MLFYAKATLKEMGRRCCGVLASSSPRFLLCSALIMSLQRGRVEAIIKITPSSKSNCFVA